MPITGGTISSGPCVGEADGGNVVGGCKPRFETRSARYLLNNKYTKIHAVEESDTLCVPLVFHVQGENGPPVLSNDVVVVVETNTMKSSSEDGKGDSDSDDSPEKRRRELACVCIKPPAASLCRPPPPPPLIPYSSRRFSVCSSLLHFQDSGRPGHAG